MDSYETLKLIAETETVTGPGVIKTTPGTGRNVFCAVGSVSASENFNGVTAGFRPSKKAVLRDSRDYAGERLCELNGEKYEIYRTYLTNNGGIELYLQRRAGVSGR